MRIGDTIRLWKTRYESLAYQDQFGLWHGGYVVEQEFAVTITESRPVRGTWGTGEHTGYKGVDEQGQEFTIWWNSFPDDSMTPSYFWDVMKTGDELWRPVNAEQAVRVYPHMDANGQPMKIAKA